MTYQRITFLRQLGFQVRTFTFLFVVTFDIVTET